MNQSALSAPTSDQIVGARVREKIVRAAHWLHGQDPGVVAELRRMEADHLGPPAFWRMLAAVSLDEELRGLREEECLERERRWAIIFRTLAVLGRLHAPGGGLGKVLSDHDFSEYRFLRLLRAHGPALDREIRMTVHWISSQGLAVDACDIADLVLSDGSSWEEKVRHRLARDFFGGKGRGGRS